MTMHDLSAEAIENAARDVDAIKTAAYRDCYPSSITLRKFIGYSVEIEFNGLRYRADLLRCTKGVSVCGAYEYKLTPASVFEWDASGGD